MFLILLKLNGTFEKNDDYVKPVTPTCEINGGSQMRWSVEKLTHMEEKIVVHTLYKLVKHFLPLS